MKTVVSEKGQVTIPKRLRDRLGIRPGQALAFHEEQGRLVAVKVDVSDRIAAVYGAARLGRTTNAIMAELRDEAVLP